LNGFILHEDTLRVVIATGFSTPSDNRKTGDMIQIWILVRSVSPTEAIRTGLDRLICGSCVHRGHEENGRFGVEGLVTSTPGRLHRESGGHGGPETMRPCVVSNVSWAVKFASVRMVIRLIFPFPLLWPSRVFQAGGQATPTNGASHRSKDGKPF